MTIWNDNQEQVIKTLSFESPVGHIYWTKKMLIVVTESTIEAFSKSESYSDPKSVAFGDFWASSRAWVSDDLQLLLVSQKNNPDLLQVQINHKQINVSKFAPFRNQPVRFIEFIADQ